MSGETQATAGMLAPQLLAFKWIKDDVIIRSFVWDIKLVCDLFRKEKVFPHLKKTLNFAKILFHKLCSSPAFPDRYNWL